ncbi:telomeric repeat binding factor a isoform X2 [Colossoma macropomum]|uniref:telomeric repeat binding factor a isoform X2 n=1 Tax=Colossoma macropomum TaxID=42526 RepID=UPI0018654029|nr:telomeric repeat binding factor a isoform X2 [Colossoma macropomum]
MAAAVKQLGCEKLINRWNFDFYASRAVDAFRNADYSGFTQFRDLIEALVVRPIDGCSDMKIKLRLMQFLSQINDGDKPDVRFQNHLTPLESALKTFEDICTETEVLQNDLEKVHTSIREMLVIVCIKNEQFQKAGDMLHRYFPRGTDSAGKKKLLEDLIKRRCSRHAVIKSASYSEFKQDMLDFIEKLYPLPEPFLVKIVKSAKQGQRIDVGVPRAVRAAHEQSSTQDRATQSKQLPSEQTVAEHCLLKPGPNLPARNGHRAQPTCPSVTVPLSLNRLRTVYLELAKIFSVSASFSQLEEEVQKEAEQESGIDLELNELNLRLSETPVDVFLRQDEENGSAVEERSSQAQPNRDDHSIDQPVEQEKERPGDLTVTGSIMETSGSGSILAPYQVREVNSATPESTNAHPLENSKRSPGAAVSAITVAQLVIEEDSQPSDMEATDCQQTPSPLKTGSSEDDPLRSLPINSTPVRKKRRPASNRRSIPSEPEPASPQQPTEPQNWSTPMKGASPSPSSSECTPDELHKQTLKMRRRNSESGSEEGIVMDSPASARRPNQSTYRRLMNVTGQRELWSDEESLFAPSTSTSARGQGSSSSDSQGKRKMWTNEESDWVKQGVARYGEGRWEKIKCSFPFKGRTAVNIKDRWRTMKKQKLV